MTSPPKATSLPHRILGTLALIVLALVLGLVVALLIRTILLVVATCEHLLWEALPDAVDVVCLPLVLCTVGGLAIGLWTKRFGGSPQSLETVISSVRETSAYRVKSLPASLVGFVLPLAFGGAIGPEAGISGIIASLCTSVGDSLKRAGLRVKTLDDLTVSAVLTAVFGAPFAGVVAGDAASGHGDHEVSLRRGARIVLYAVAAGGAFVGVALFQVAFGGGTGLPRLEMGRGFLVSDLPWMLVCLAAAWALAVVYTTAEHGFARLSRHIGRRPVLKAVTCGIALGAVGTALPFALFSGEEQVAEIAVGWQALPALMLLAAAIAKAVLTPLCLEFGWRGGHFFPCIFMGVALGYGIASLAGADPVCCAAIASGAFLACTMRKPVLAAALLLLCFPARSLLWLLLAALVGGYLPLPFENEGD